MNIDLKIETPGHPAYSPHSIPTVVDMAGRCYFGVSARSLRRRILDPVQASTSAVNDEINNTIYRHLLSINLQIPRNVRYRAL